MKPVDNKTLLVSLKLIGLLCIAFLAILFLPGYAHHLLLVISAALILSGFGSLLGYREQAKWIEGTARLTSVNEREEEVAVSEYSRIKYYYPEMEYEYMTNGALRSGKSVSIEKENVWVPEVNKWGDPTPEEKRWWLAFKPGDEIPVYINPSDEGEAVLVRDVIKARRSHHLALTAGGFLLGLTWLLLVSYK